MIKKWIGPLVMGIGGVAILVSLGMWQVQRLAWKEGILAEIEVRIAADPVALPASVDPVADEYLPVEVTGQFGEAGLRVLASRKQIGAGHRLIQVFETGERRVMIDRGFLKLNDTAPPLPEGEVTITGNLAWPEETDGFTPEPDEATNQWFAREVPDMAAALDTEPLLIVARSLSYDAGPVDPMPVSTAPIPNDHREYAITWFSLAAIWLAMTLYLLYRTGRPQKGETT